MRPLTASGLDRAEKCAASQHLPHVVDDREHGGRDRGTALHRYLETRDLAQVPEQWRAEAAAINLEALDVVGQWANEVAFALDVETGAGRVLGAGLERDYPPTADGEIPGTADLLGLTTDAVVVLDLKTAHTLPPPEQALQLLHLALAAASAYDRGEAFVGWLRLIGGEPVFSWAKLDGFALSEALQRIRVLMRSVVEGKDSAPVLGGHCKWCPAQLRCPAYTGVLATLTGKDAVAIDESDLPAALDRLDAVELAAKAARQLIDEMARAKPIRLPNGDVYGVVTTEREKLDVTKAQAVIGGTLPEAFETEVSVSKASVRRALVTRCTQTGEKITKAMDATVDLLRKAGAVRVERYDAVKRFRPGLTEGTK